MPLFGCIVESLQAPFNYVRKAENKKAAKAGDPEAMYEYGSAYCCGAPLYYSNSEGTLWLCRAARVGHSQAMADIGYWWRSEKKGLGAPGLLDRASILPDDAVAYAWTYLAAQRGNADAVDALPDIEGVLSPKAMERAQRYVQHFPDMPCEMY